MCMCACVGIWSPSFSLLQSQFLLLHLLCIPFHHIAIFAAHAHTWAKLSQYWRGSLVFSLYVHWHITWRQMAHTILSCCRKCLLLGWLDGCLAIHTLQYTHRIRKITSIQTRKNTYTKSPEIERVREIEIEWERMQQVKSLRTKNTHIHTYNEILPSSKVRSQRDTAWCGAARYISNKLRFLFCSLCLLLFLYIYFLYLPQFLLLLSLAFPFSLWILSFCTRQSTIPIHL